MGNRASTTTTAPILRNESGMTLIEVMMVVTIMSVLAVTFAQFFSNIARQQKLAQMKGYVLQTQLMMQNQMVNPNAIWQSGQP